MLKKLFMVKVWMKNPNDVEVVDDIFEDEDDNDDEDEVMMMRI